MLSDTNWNIPLQGTNAHAIVEVCENAGTKGSIFDVQSQRWQRAPSWFCPRPHPILERCRAGPSPGDSLVIQGNLQRARLAHLKDYFVGGLSAIPPGVALEVKIW